MRIETNTKLVRRNRQIAQYLFFVSFGILILGLFVTNAQVTTEADDVLTGVILPSLVLPLAFISTMISVRMTNLWVRLPRPEVVIRENLKGISNKSVFYSYYHFPARHVLIAPQGVFAIVSKFQDGRFTVEGDRWKTHKSAISRFFSFFRLDNIGNPTLEAQRAAAVVKEQFAKAGVDIDVQPLIIFVDPRAQVTVVDPVVPVLYADNKRDPNLKDYLRDAPRRTMPTPQQIEAFEQVSLRR